MSKVKKIFITGIGGFIGGYIVDRLKNSDYEIHGLYMPEEKQRDHVIPHIGDLRDYNVIDTILQEVQPDIILHLGARTEVESSFYEQITFSEINYCGTVSLIESAKKLPNLENFVFASTMETYGAVYSKEQVMSNGAKLKPFNEETIQKPNAPYAVAKMACEKYLEYAERAYNFPFTAIRQTNTYGRHDNDFFVVEQIITQMLDNPKEIKLGYKEPWRNFIFIDDLIDLYIKIIENPHKSKGEIFCVGPDNALSIEHLVNKIADKLDWNGKVYWDQKRDRPGEIFYLNSTNKKVKEVLHWKPKYNLDKGLDKTIEMWKNKQNEDTSDRK